MLKRIAINITIFMMTQAVFINSFCCAQTMDNDSITGLKSLRVPVGNYDRVERGMGEGAYRETAVADFSAAFDKAVDSGKWDAAIKMAYNALTASKPLQPEHLRLIAIIKKRLEPEIIGCAQKFHYDWYVSAYKLLLYLKVPAADKGMFFEVMADLAASDALYTFYIVSDMQLIPITNQLIKSRDLLVKRWKEQNRNEPEDYNEACLFYNQQAASSNRLFIKGFNFLYVFVVWKEAVKAYYDSGIPDDWQVFIANLEGEFQKALKSGSIYGNTPQLPEAVIMAGKIHSHSQAANETVDMSVRFRPGMPGITTWNDVAIAYLDLDAGYAKLLIDRIYNSSSELLIEEAQKSILATVLKGRWRNMDIYNPAYIEHLKAFLAKKNRGEWIVELMNPQEYQEKRFILIKVISAKHKDLRPLFFSIDENREVRQVKDMADYETAGTRAVRQNI